MAEIERNSFIPSEYEKLAERIKNEYYHFTRLNHCSNANSFYKILDTKFKKGLPQRAKFAFVLYNYLQQENVIENVSVSNEIPSIFFQQQFPFILEVIITIQYYHNQILDGKAGVTNIQAISRNLIIGNLLKEQLYRYIEQIELLEVHRKKLREYVRNVFELVDIGQYIEKNHNTYVEYEKTIKTANYSYIFEEYVKDFINEDLIEDILDITQSTLQINPKKLSFLRLYLERIFLTNTVLYSLAAKFMTDVLEVQENEARKVTKFAAQMGLIMQMVNDNCDLLPSYFGETTTSKKKEDAFSDLCNFNITLPLIIHFCIKPHSKIKKFLDFQHYIKEEVRIKLSPEHEDRFCSEMVEKGSLSSALKISKSLKEQAISSLNINNPIANQMENLLGIADNNRYYRFFYAILDPNKASKKTRAIVNAWKNRVYKVFSKQFKKKKAMLSEPMRA